MCIGRPRSEVAVATESLGEQQVPRGAVEVRDRTVPNGMEHSWNIPFFISPRGEDLIYFLT